MIESGVTLSISMPQSDEETIHKFNNNTNLQGYFSQSTISGRIIYQTSYNDCCTNNHLHTGEWFFPNGTRIVATSSDSSIYTSRSQQEVQLHFRKFNMTDSNGIYSCIVPNLEGQDQSFHFTLQRGLP